MRLLIVVLITISASMLASCSSAPLVANEPDRELPGGFPDHTAEQIIDSLRVSMEGIHSYSTDGSIKIVSTEGSHSGGLSLRTRIGDSLSAVVRGPLGVVAGRALVTRDSMFFADRINGQEYAGPADQPPPIPPPFDAFFQMNSTTMGLTPLGLFLLDDQETWEVATDSLQYVMTRSASSLESEIAIVDPAIWKITLYRLSDQESEETHIDFTFADFDTVDGFVVPRRVTINYPEEKTAVHLEHKQIRVNPTNLNIGDRPTAPTTSRSE